MLVRFTLHIMVSQALVTSVPGISPDIMDWVQAVQAVGSLILTLLIYIVYRKIRDIQNTQADIQLSQTNIMDRQNQILSAEYQPDISGDIVNANDDLEPIEGDTTNLLHLDLVNQGRGKGKDLLLTSFVYRSKETDDTEKPVYSPVYGMQIADWGFTVAGFTTQLTRRDQTADSVNSIPPTGEHYTYYADFKFVISVLFSNTKYEASFSEVLSRAAKEWEEVDKLAFDVYVIYRDDTNRLGYENLCTILDVPVREGLELDEALELAEITQIPMEYYVPEGFDVKKPEFDKIDIQSGRGIFDSEG